MLLLLDDSGFNVRQELFAQNEQGIYLDPTLSESARTWRRNLLGYTEDYSNSYWTKASVTTATEVVANPINGTVTRLESTTTAAVGIGLERNIASALDTFSIYVKKGNARYIGLTTQASATNTVFDLDTGTVASQAAFHSTATITDAGDGWFRISVTADNSSSNSVVRVRFFTGPTTIGAVTGDYTYVTGAQLEERSTASTYQKLTDFSTEFKAAFPTHTIYQDSNGVAPVTAPGDLVGLVLDKSQGGLDALGPELKGDGYIGLVGSATEATYDTATGVGEVARVDIGNQSFVRFTVTAGKFYQIKIQNTGANNVLIRTGGAGGSVLYTSTPGTTVTVIVNNTSVDLFFTAVSGVASFVVSTIREVPGNHAYQSTSGARPTLGRVPFGGRRNLLTRTEEFDNAVWLKQTNGTGSVPVVTANTSVAPDGTTTADTIVFDRGAGNTTDDRSVLLQSYSAVTSTVYTGSIYLKAATAGDIGKQLALRVMGTATFQVITLTADWARYSLQETAHLTGTRNIEIMNRGTFSADNTVTALVWGGQVEPGSTATTYQRVGSTHDVTEAGQPDCWYLDTSGSKWMQTNAIDFAGWTQGTRRNLLFEGDQFDATGWTKTNSTITANAVANPVNGAIDADLMIESVATGAHNVTRADFNCVAGQAYTCSCYVKAAGRTVFQMVITSGVVTSGFANFDLQNGVVGSKAAGVTSTYMVDSGNGWYRCVAEFTSASTTTGIINFSTVTTPTSARAESYTGDGTSGIYIYGGQWEAGTLTDYQRVGTDEMTVIAGVRKLSDAAYQSVIEFGPTGGASNDGGFAIGASSTTGDASRRSYAFITRGTVQRAELSPAVYTAPITNVLAVNFDNGGATVQEQILARINSVSQSGTYSLVTSAGNFANAILYAGGRAGTTNFFNGHLFHLIIRGKTTEGSKLTGAERITARKAGITI